MKYSIIHVVAVTATSILTALMVSFLPGALGSPYVLKDDRVRSLDVTPVLGRGYSIMTNTFLSTCLEGALFTTPSYNYDCKYCSVAFCFVTVSHSYIIFFLYILTIFFSNKYKKLLIHYFSCTQHYFFSLLLFYLHTYMFKKCLQTHLLI